MNFCFKIICLTETWSKDQHMAQNSLFNIPNYSIIHQDRKNDKRGGGVCIYIHNSITYKERHDLSLCDDDSESHCVELIDKTSKNIIITTIYRPPNGKIKPLKNYLKNLFSKNMANNKLLYLVGDLNLNIIDFECNTKIKNFFNLVFEHGLVPVINKPTRITKKRATAIDHIITNSYLNHSTRRS